MLDKIVPAAVMIAVAISIFTFISTASYGGGSSEERLKNVEEQFDGIQGDTTDIALITQHLGDLRDEFALLRADVKGIGTQVTAMGVKVDTLWIGFISSGNSTERSCYTPSCPPLLTPTGKAMLNESIRDDIDAVLASLDLSTISDPSPVVIGKMVGRLEDLSVNTECDIGCWFGIVDAYVSQQKGNDT